MLFVIIYVFIIENDEMYGHGKPINKACGPNYEY